MLSKTVWTNTTGGPVSTLTTYGYDEERSGFHNIGRQTTAENPVGKLTFDYDVAGRLVQKTYRLDSVDYVFAFGYDAAGRLLWQSFPDSDGVGSALDPIEYDGAGRTKAIPGVIADASYDARGWATSVLRGNGVVTSYGYSAERGWLTSVETLSGAATVQDFGYTRRADGQILAIGSSIAEESWSYGYDDLKRLTTATNTDNASYSRTISYDTVGNITAKSDVGSYSYPTPGSARPHAATAAGALGSSYSYDDNGNMTAGGGRTLVWDGEDRPTDINGTAFAYGPDGARWKKTALGGAQDFDLFREPLARRPPS